LSKVEVITITYLDFQALFKRLSVQTIRQRVLYLKECSRFSLQFYDHTPSLNCFNRLLPLSFAL